MLFAKQVITIGKQKGCIYLEFYTSHVTITYSIVIVTMMVEKSRDRIQKDVSIRDPLTEVAENAESSIAMNSPLLFKRKA